MQCSKCGQPNRIGAKFCEECASRLVGACVNCGGVLSETAKFCPECGSATNINGARPRLVSPESYTPKYLAERILRSKSALEGERKLVTVLFADLQGSTELLADRDPEEARKLLDPILGYMIDAVHRYEGTVNQVMGDGVMALFGAPLAQEDHAVRACYAALRMQEATKAHAQSIFRSHGVPVQIRVGLNSGEVVVRAIGSDLHMDYTAVGQTTHLAARMERMAMPGVTLLTPATLQLAEGYIQVAPRGPVSAKGFQDPIDVFELTGANALRSRLQAAAARGLTRFVGRDAEIEQLAQALERAGAGRGQVIAVVGEPGVGKSRLFWEFVHSHRTQRWLIVESSSVSYGKMMAFLPLVDMLRSYFMIEPSDEAGKIRERVTGKLFSLDHALEPCLSALFWLLDVPVEDARWERLDPPQRRKQALEAIKRLMLRESQVQPVLLLFEDLHWIDRATQSFLEDLVESLPKARLLLVVNYRPEYQHSWGGKTYYRQLRVDPLPPENVEELLDTLVGSDPRLQPLKQLLIAKVEGNPFFLEESVKTLVETSVLSGERGDYHLARATQNFQVPATAQAILSSRIDRLSPEDKRLLQAASVIGKDAPFALLQEIAEAPDEEIRLGLKRLQAGEFLYEARLFPDLELTFKHTLIHEVTYGGLLQERRRALHAAIVDAIERRNHERLGEHVERLAHHAVRGELWEKAVGFCRQAAAKAMAQSANREAATHIQQALAALEHLPESRETLARAIDVRLEMRHALWPLGENARILQFLQPAEGIAESLADHRRLCLVLSTIGYSRWMLGEHDRVVASNRRALATAIELGDFAIQVGAGLALGLALHGLGQYREAVKVLQGNVSLLHGERRYGRFGTAGTTSVNSIMVLAWCHAELGSFAEGAAVGEEGLRIARVTDHPLSLVFAELGVGHLYVLQGDLVRAIPALERATAACRKWDFPSLLPLVASLLGAAYALAGRAGDALPLLEQSVAQASSIGWKADSSRQAARLGLGYMAAGRMKDAFALASRALDHAVEQKSRGHEAWALHLLGEIVFRSDPRDPERAEAYYRKALLLAEELGMRPLAAHCQLGLGRSYERTGKVGEAQQAHASAREMHREMDMQFWLQRRGG